MAVLSTYYDFRNKFADEGAEVDGPEFAAWPTEAPSLILHTNNKSVWIAFSTSDPSEQHHWYCRTDGTDTITIKEPPRHAGDTINLRGVTGFASMRGCRIYCKRVRDGAIGSVLLAPGGADVIDDACALANEPRTGERAVGVAGEMVCGTDSSFEVLPEHKAVALIAEYNHYRRGGLPLPPKFAKYDCPDMGTKKETR